MKMKQVKEIIEKQMKDMPTTNREVDRGLLAIRVGLGLFFIYHGLGKFFGFAPDGGIEVFTGMLGGLGFPVPVFWAYLVAFVELFGGAAILLGFFTRISAVFLAVITVVAFVLVKDFSPEAGGLDILAFAMAISLVLSGPGKISFAERWYREESESKSSSSATKEKKEIQKESIAKDNSIKSEKKTEDQEEEKKDKKPEDEVIQL